MKTYRFSIDSFPQNNNLTLADDYNSKIVYSAITDRLFIFSKEKNQYLCNACEKYDVQNNFKKYIIFLRNDLYFYEGTKVNAEDYQNAIFDFLNSETKLKSYFKNIKYLKSENNSLIFELYLPDKNFINKLSIYQICPKIKNNSNGPYYIDKVKDNIIYLKNNPYYRNNKNININFNVISSEKENISKFLANEIDITNNTLFPLDIDITGDNIYVEPSNIIFNLEFSTKIPCSIRKYIAKSISIEDIVKNFQDCANVTTFSLKNHNSKANIKTIKSEFNFNREFIIYYNQFYPNQIIASLISEELNKYNIKNGIQEYKYGENKILHDNEISLVLNYFEFYDELYFYNSEYFKLLMRNNKLYLKLLKLYEKYDLEIIIKFLNKLILKKYVKIPLFSLNSIYYAKRELSKFSYLELNYDLIDN